MEDEHLLDPNDDMHLYCLHLVFMPRINRHLELWREAWNHHPMSSVSNKTPLQSWVEGRPRNEARLQEPEVYYKLCTCACRKANTAVLVHV